MAGQRLSRQRNRLTRRHKLIWAFGNIHAGWGREGDAIVSYELGEAQVEVQTLIRRVAREKVAPRADEIDRTAAYPQDMFDLLKELGLFTLPFPADYGGGGSLLSGSGPRSASGGKHGEERRSRRRRRGPSGGSRRRREGCLLRR